VTEAGQPVKAPETSLAHPQALRVRQPVPPPDVTPATAAEDGTLSVGDLLLDESRWTVHRAGQAVDLSPTEFRLLACLMRHQGNVLSRTQLLRSVWGRDYTGQPQIVETYVSYLRRKLDRLGPPLIRTRRGLGYTLLDTSATHIMTPPPRESLSDAHDEGRRVFTVNC
jgi:two-component system OmpR family response regulator